MLGYQDLLVILGIGALLFGAKKLPELARSLGQSMKEFKKSVAGDPESASLVPSTPSRTCNYCKTPLKAEWTHCPRCGTPAPQESPSAPT